MFMLAPSLLSSDAILNFNNIEFGGAAPRRGVQNFRSDVLRSQSTSGVLE